MKIKWLNDFRYLTLAQIYNQLSFLPFLVFISTLLPLAMVFGLGLIGGGAGRQGLAQIVVGSAVVSIVSLAISVLAPDLAYERRHGAFIYYASLPVSKSAFLLAIVTVRLINTLPGVLITLLAGNALYDLSLTLSPWLLLIVPLTIVSLVGVGGAIGLSINNPTAVGLVGNVALIFVMFAAPVMIPAEALPAPLQVIGKLLPPTYAANAFRAAVLGQGLESFGADLLALLGFAVVSMAVVTRTLKWRLD